MSTIVIGPGQRELDLARACARAASRASAACTRPFSRSGADHLRHHRLVAVVADAHLDLVLEVDAFDLLEEAVHEVLARLLAVADDVEAGVFLGLDPQQRGVELGLRAARRLRRFQLRPQLAGLGQPGGLGQAAGDRGVEHRRVSR